MNQDAQNGLHCSQFEALLADALDLYANGANTASSPLTPEERKAFEEHRSSCAICGPMFAEAQQGMEFLRALPDLDPPQNLVHNILARTSRAEVPAPAADTAAQPARNKGWGAWVRPAFAGLVQSRFATSFAMAFFSLTLTLSLAGVKFSDLAKIDWRPSALRKSMVLQYTHVEAKVVSYYENMRLVYEVEHRVNQLKKATAPQDNNNQRERQNWNHPDNPSPHERRDNVVRELDDPRQQADAGPSTRSETSLVAKSTTKDEGVQL